MKTLRVGAQLFVNRHDSSAQVKLRMKAMADAGFSLVRVFLVWDHLEPSENQWNWDVYDTVFSAAEATGIGVVGTLMSVSPPGWMRRSQGLQDVGNLDDPAFWARSLDYVRRVVGRWHRSPALHSWILWNEPARPLVRSAHTLPPFRDFLERKYEGKIANLNRFYYRQYATFSEVLSELDNGSYGLGFGSRVEEIDWIEFTGEHLRRKLRDIRDELRRIDAAHPIHVNPHRMSQCMLQDGQSIWREAELVDFMGFSAHPPWHSTRFPLDRIQQSIAMFADLARSSTPDASGRFWCTELQGGPTLVTAFRPSSPSASDITRWMWECAGSGAEAVVFWCFNTREDGYEAGEWSLCQTDGRPSPRLTAASNAARTFDRCGDWFQGAKAAPDVAILCSESTQLLGLIEGEGDDVRNPRNRQMGADAVCGAYLMASDLGFETAFVDEAKLIAQALPTSASVLLAPGCAVIDAATLSAMEKWVRAGGTLIADSVFGWKTATGSLALDVKERLAKLFGADMLDYTASSDLVFQDRQKNRANGWFFRIEFGPVKHGQKIASWPDGTPAVIETTLGKGRVLRIGTSFFQRYLSSPESSQTDMLKSWLGPRPPTPIRLKHPGAALRLRRLSTEKGIVAVILCETGRKQADVQFTAAGRWQTLDKSWKDAAAGSRAAIPLDADGIACLRFEFASAGTGKTSPTKPAGNRFKKQRAVLGKASAAVK